MVAISETPRLTIQTVEIAPNTIAIRSLDWDRDRFDIEFSLQNGTTYNSYLIQGEETILIDTSHQKFRQLYLETLNNLVDPQTIDYIIVSHTEPDHSGLIEDVLRLAPRATVLASRVAIQFLEGLVHSPFSKRIVKSGDRVNIGKGHEIEFVSAPNLHWPDTIFSFDRKTQILYTCDAFGMHFCDHRTFDEDLEAIEADFRFYYDCLMGPNSRSLLNAMKRMGELGKIKIIASGHGPLLYHHLETLTEHYQNWSQKQTKTENTEKTNNKQTKSLDVNMEKALGRISSGLYIITAKKGEISDGMMASWVAQASFQPLGFTIAVAHDRPINNLLQPGDRFILNVLAEGNYQELKKHFLKRLLPGMDRFAGVKFQPGKNGSPILNDALAYIECEVISRMECSDHRILYCTVEDGKVSQTNGLTAVRHRKVGNYY
ncbi:hypothetical protein CEP10_05060 [Cylindrospermopsis raciborskii S07]|uniref:Diflavin flavoprotein A n=3 Tax=Cylindrospermopsis raciborskii TaxID=77022 RepID=A0A853MC42_9CYAN|nr:diflavin flavoprotein [Cylindrospermopsis raciborskii]EFA71426.1 Flavin reductase-like protein, FMN-binding [Cylindrospermopsis raciborskii CS-505]MBA4444623.1 flavin reductase [Cylindrospermopsis raciborskii CS-506_C]MBA4448839.1 flavin reductase [Cylindrospermopsis raciborskii CS-506_D]MBA4455473.1 flavin reductase [Cylindrospermopsis raciborskii CS-506_B]MBA4464821.1 flavin reductase [Cylindrospermopsis raciborskii CS-506_A]